MRSLLLKFYISILEHYRNIQNLPYKRQALPLLKDNELLIRKINDLDEVNLSECTYYIIRRDNAKIGLLTFVSLFLGHISYAVAKGYIPVIDMKHFPNIYLEESMFGKVNAWEHFFKQPFNIGLDDIHPDSKKMYSPLYIQPASPFVNSVLSDQESLIWKTLFKKYIRFNSDTEIYLKRELKEIIGTRRVLGLLYRGTDYRSLKPINHPIQPTIQEFVDCIEKCVAEWGDFDYYYIATDERSAVEALELNFPGKILINERRYYDDFKNISYLAEAKFDRENDNFLKGLEYLSSIYLLSKCESIIAGLCAGTYAANFMKENDYKNKFFFDLGLYK